ncbi:MAG TPA: hypothetical protein VLZ29_00960 [Sulfurimonas sp.]|jgi:hypothetical protein|uniref:hypothetical protein n=1 Tax=Sulfurimonas sp. TaxID=2022749 RepID=UPI002B60E4A4|nr:hypothetical protein [Sulfurimonas sp.]HUH41668.1 hypothetical protein [Sulfurimonas sp.]
MEISSSNTPTQTSADVEASKKTMESKERDVLKVLETVNEESQKDIAQKTGLGINLNLAG